MDVQSVISNLTSAEAGSRTLDGQIASAMGWRKRVEPFIHPKTGEKKTRVLWLVSSSDEAILAPKYTTSLQCAYQLAQQISPGHVGAIVVENGVARAQLGEHAPVFRAATPALALCAAAVSMLQP